jgi:mono/diheme cytochrome c family protein
VLTGCGDDGMTPTDSGPADSAPGDSAPGDSGPTDGGGDAGPDPQVARGQYLVLNVAQCPFCHSPIRMDGTIDPALFMSGVDCLFDIDPMMAGFGCIASRNLTNHETGLMNATDDQIKRAFRDGIGIDGRVLLPLMPYRIFHNMTDADADAIVAYLRTLNGVDNMVAPSEPPFDMPPPMAPPPIAEASIPMPEASFPDQPAAMRGRYLAAMASACIECHTPADPAMPMNPFSLDETRFFGGGREFPAAAFGFPVPPFPPLIYSRNLTQHATGIMGYTIEDVENVLSMGVDPMGDGVCAPTHGSPSAPYAGLTDEDARDIASYIVSLPDVDNMVMENCMGPPPL